MKVFSAEQISAWDAYTIREEPIASIDLMERAANACVRWILQAGLSKKHLHIFCGKGNNGGDGLAISRLLLQEGCALTVYIMENGKLGTADFQTNLARLHALTKEIHFLQSSAFFPELTTDDIVIDALVGTGLNKPLEGVMAALAEHINLSPAPVVSIDLPSGMFADKSSKEFPCLRADHTLSFQLYKTGFLLAENADNCGSIHLLTIGLHPSYYESTIAYHQLVDSELISTIYKKRKSVSHKGNFGHALLMAGSYGKTGAALLAATACMRSGAGLLTVHTPRCGYTTLQTGLPEAMLDSDPEEDVLSQLPKDLLRYAAIGIGPGIGLHEKTADLLLHVLKQSHQPIVLDADALNLLSIKQNLAAHLHEACILTPHPKEFERLFGKSANDFERKELAQEKAIELNCVIVLKGHYTFIACPDGNAYFNSTGNAGMATAGSGDVLTGMLTGLLAQGYNTVEASLLGVYLHGLAGDLAAQQLSQEAMIAGDIHRNIGNAFLQLSQTT
jgi:hydroxyethylthiazole kinase-like uncharacterized protein yjeF